MAFHSAMRAERFTDAEALYRGLLLDGVHADAPGFEEWLTIERRRCQEDAVVASWAMARRLEGENSITLASRHARQAARLAESDERMLRNAIKLLERGGDRAGALQLYQEFCERLKRDLDVEPSAETRALVAALRSS